MRSLSFSLITFKIKYIQSIGPLSHFGIKENIYYIKQHAQCEKKPPVQLNHVYN